jgi:hypothetical protein
MTSSGSPDFGSANSAKASASQSSWLVAGMLPGIERHPRKKLEPSPRAAPAKAGSISPVATGTSRFTWLEMEAQERVQAPKPFADRIALSRWRSKPLPSDPHPEWDARISDAA